MSSYYKAGFVICADDFGLSLQVNAAILDLIAQNKLDAVSVLVEKLKNQNSEQKKLIQNKSKILLGLHLDLFKDNFLKFVWLCFFNNSEIKKQTEAQLNLFKEIFERWPDYIDGHQHCHIYPFARRALVSLLLEKKINLTFVRSVQIHPSIFALTTSLTNKLYLHWLQFLNERFIRILSQTELVASGYLFGSFYDHAQIQSIYKSYQSFSQNQNDLLFCHPSLNNSTSADTISKARVQDYEFFKQLE